MRSFTLGVLALLSSLFAPLVSGDTLPHSVNISCSVVGNPGAPCNDLTSAGYSVSRDFSNPHDLSSLTFSARATAFSGGRQDGDGVVLIFNVLDLAFTPGPVRPGFMDIVGSRGTLNGFTEATIGSIDFKAPPPPETVPILLGTAMPVRIGMLLPPFFVDGPTFSDGRAELFITGVRDASGNPVPIFAASQVPEPNELAALAFALLIGAIATRRRCPWPFRKT